MVSNSEGPKLARHVVAKTPSIVTQPVFNPEFVPARIVRALTLDSRATERIIQVKINMIKWVQVKGCRNRMHRELLIKNYRSIEALANPDKKLSIMSQQIPNLLKTKWRQRIWEMIRGIPKILMFQTLVEVQQHRLRSWKINCQTIRESGEITSKCCLLSKIACTNALGARGQIARTIAWISTWWTHQTTSERLSEITLTRSKNQGLDYQMSRTRMK